MSVSLSRALWPGIIGQLLGIGGGGRIMLEPMDAIGGESGSDIAVKPFSLVYMWDPMDLSSPLV